MTRTASIKLALFMGAAVGWPSIAVASSESILSSATLTQPAAGGLPPYFATVDVTGTPSAGALGSVHTTVMSIWVGPSNTVIGVGWDVTLRSVRPTSWISDIAMFVGNSANVPFDGFFITPGGADGFPAGPTMYSSGGLLPWHVLGVPQVQALADGMIRLEFFETFIDAPGEVEGSWDSGEFFLQTDSPIPPIPAPGAPMFAYSTIILFLSVRRQRGSLR